MRRRAGCDSPARKGSSHRSRSSRQTSPKPIAPARAIHHGTRIRDNSTRFQSTCQSSVNAEAQGAGPSPARRPTKAGPLRTCAIRQIQPPPCGATPPRICFLPGGPWSGIPSVVHSTVSGSPRLRSVLAQPKEPWRKRSTEWLFTMRTAALRSYGGKFAAIVACRREM